MSNDDLQLLREFRAEIPAPSEETRRKIYVRATSEPAGPHVRRWRLPSAAAAAVVAAAAIAVLLVSPWSGSDGGLVQRALAAVGTGPVMHIVMEDSTNTAWFNLKTGRETGGTSREEIWIDRQNNRFQFINSQGGRILAGLHGTFRSRPASGSRPAFSAAALVDFYGALATGFHTAIVGRGTFDGHHIYWLRSPSSEAPGEVGVDARTYKPLLLRFNHPPSPYYYERILLAKAIPYDAGDFGRRGPIPNRAPRSVVVFTDGFTPARINSSGPHSTVVRAPWLTAGTAVAGLKLSALRPFTFRKIYNKVAEPNAVHGLELVYGPSSHGHKTTLPTRINVFGPRAAPRATTHTTNVYEFHRIHFDESTSWSNVPADSIEIQTGYTTIDNDIVHTPWIGYMWKQDLYITISTPQGEHALLQIARTLHTGSN